MFHFPVHSVEVSFTLKSFKDFVTSPYSESFLFAVKTLTFPSFIPPAHRDNLDSGREKYSGSERGQGKLLVLVTLTSGQAWHPPPGPQAELTFKTVRSSAVVQLLTRPGLGSKNSDLKDTTKTKEKLSIAAFTVMPTHFPSCRHYDLICACIL